jgi:4-amino-4-deoxy-L-arabinose transferase-like glycosyltransferase
VKYKIILLIITLVGAFLRFYQLDQNPPGFYSDEASYAYNAYAVLQTGKDEHAVFLPITTEAFGDYKLPVMLYSIVGSFALLGPSDFAARVPGALYGLLTIPLMYLLTKELIKLHEENTHKTEITALIAALIITIAPSHIFVSRGTWELTPALFFITLATYTFLKWLKKDSFILLLTTALSFVLSMYAYNSARVFVPVFVFSLAILFHKQLVKKIKTPLNALYLAVTLVIATLTLFPIITSISSPAVTQRAKYISIFYDQTVNSNLFEAIRSDGGQNVKLTQFFHNKPVYYATDMLKRYLSHFDFNFLFTIGDTFEIFQLVGLGFLPLLALPFLLIGIYYLLKERPQWAYILLAWLLISPLASSLTKFTPSTSRAMNMIIPLAICTAYGVVSAQQFLKRKVPELQTFTWTTLAILLIGNTLYIYNQYFVVTPKVTAEKWNDGFKNTVHYVNSVQQDYDSIIISSAKAPSYIFYAWYTKYDPQKFQQEAVVNHRPDENGLNFTAHFGKFSFTKDIKSAQKQIPSGQKTLIVGFENELQKPTKLFYSRNGKIVHEAYEQR